MLKYFLLLFFSISCLSIKADNKAVIDDANKAYADGNFEESIKLYKNVLSQGVEAPQIYFNLGNSYFKTNNIAYAILNYEKAKKLSPDDEDIIVNLKIANQKITDKVDVLPTFFIKEWQNNFVTLMPEKYWSILCLVLFSGAFLFLALYLSINSYVQKQVTFGISIILFFLSITSFAIARKQKNFLESKTDAIIISASVTVKSSPSENGNKLFIIHEGIKVTIVGSKDDWTEIKLANGNVGWLKSSSFILI